MAATERPKNYRMPRISLTLDSWSKVQFAPYRGQLPIAARIGIAELQFESPHNQLRLRSRHSK
jgi:hypothetical protein